MINVPFMGNEEGGMSARSVQCCSSNTGLWQSTVQGGATDSPEETPPCTPFLVEHSRLKSHLNYKSPETASCDISSHTSLVLLLKTAEMIS